MTAVIVTLFEGDYVLGVGSLVNSLVRNGFSGKVYAGYRGRLTLWAESTENGDDGSMVYQAGAVKVHFFPVAGGWHLTNLKPQIMLDVWEKWEPCADAMFYFDPDIVVTCRWSFFEEWVRCGVALCQEVTMAPMPDDHPIRCYWREWADRAGWPAVREMDTPFNAGFVGVSRGDMNALALWRSVIERMSSSVNMSVFLPGDRSDPFYIPDQDALNIISMIHPGRLSRIGPESMAFVPGGFTMAHAAGGVKPWRKRFIRSALGGVPPSTADKGWFANTEGAVQVLSPLKRRRIGISIRIGAALGRFIRRS